MPRPPPRKGKSRGKPRNPAPRFLFEAGEQTLSAVAQSATVTVPANSAEKSYTVAAPPASTVPAGTRALGWTLKVSVLGKEHMLLVASGAVSSKTVRVGITPPAVLPPSQEVKVVGPPSSVALVFVWTLKFKNDSGFR